MLTVTQKKDLILTLTKYEFKLRYRGAVLGVLWSLIAPFLLAVVLYLVFRNVFNFIENFALYVLVGVFVFRFFSVATSVGMHSVIGKAHLVTKTNLERSLLPLATTLSYAISSLIEFAILIPILLLFGSKVSFVILLLPLLHVIYTIFIYGLNLFLSAIMVHFRDLNQMWEVITNVLFFASPIVYPISIIPESYRSIYMLNPISAIIELYRGVMIYESVNLNLLVYFSIAAILTLLTGYAFFAMLQRRFGEVL